MNFGPDNNHLIERLLIAALQNEQDRTRLLTLQINNENYRTELLLREHELVEASAAQVAATVKAQEELRAAQEHVVRVEMETALRDRAHRRMRPT